MPIDSVKVIINGATTTLTDNGNGTYSATLAAPNVTSYNVNSGHYYPVTVVATNAAGTSTTASDAHATLGTYLRLKVKEITAPTITISAPTAGQYLATARPSVKIRLVDESNGSGVAISTLSVKVDSTTYTNTSNGVTVSSITNGYDVTLVPPSALSEGSHTVTVSVTDNDGNTATTKSVSFTTDTVAPTLSVTNPSANSSYTANSSMSVTGTVSDSTSGTPSVRITLNGTDVGAVTVSNGTFTKGIVLAHGSNTIVITATDLAGKVTTITRTVTLDTSAPIIAAVNITPNPVNVGSNYTITITVE